MRLRGFTCDQGATVVGGFCREFLDSRGVSLTERFIHLTHLRNQFEGTRIIGCNGLQVNDRAECVTQLLDVVDDDLETLCRR